MLDIVLVGIFPLNALRFWLTCEETFRIFINLSIKVVLERVHKLNFISSVENCDEIVFFRVKSKR